MTYVITDACAGACAMECVHACPVDAIHGPVSERALSVLAPDERARRVASLQLYIDPEQCICCGACEPTCPESAIFDESSLPDDKAWCLDDNARYFAARR